MQFRPKSLFDASVTPDMPALDGLRFLAFLAVFTHHIAPPAGLVAVHTYGWVGVELFLVISAFLFFTLFEREWERTGGLSIRKFFARRTLRIYPLMAVYPLMVGAYFYPLADPMSAAGRYLALLALSDNTATAVGGYNVSIPLTAHLWTLSYEAQVYAVIPFAYVALRIFGCNRFLLALAGVAILAWSARALAIYWQVPHPAIWVLPVLRPESTLIGMLLAMFIWRIQWWGAAVAAAFGAALWMSAAQVNVIAWPLMLTYPAVSLLCASLVYAAIRSEIVGKLLSVAPLRFLGAISYGLYVYHLLAIYAAARIAPTAAPTKLACVALALCVAMATLSYYTLERPFLRAKAKLAAQASDDSSRENGIRELPSLTIVLPVPVASDRKSRRPATTGEKIPS